VNGEPRPRRSVLYVPGSNERALEKARTVPADTLILDLEDAVAPSAKREARERLADALDRGGYGAREIVLRVNGPDTPWWEEDIAWTAAARVDAVLIPKVERAETMRAAEQDLRLAGVADDVPLWCMIETPLAVLHLREIAAATPRLAALVLGTSDLVKDLRARHTPGRIEVTTSMAIAVLTARAFGLAALDGVHLDLEDMDGFAAACRQARDMGFDGKTLIHPKTIAVANEVFGPSADDLAWARRVIEAHARAEDQGSGVTVVDGRLVENLHVEEARRVLALADAIAERESE
jgi:citrate lyase subunit beta / citryl-CoA lyase